MNKNSILIASPVHKPKVIVKEFLDSLNRLDHGESLVSYCFVDDNEDEESTHLIEDFALKNSNVTLLEIPDIPKNQIWEKGEHCWSSNKIDKVAMMKNHIISYFLQGDYTHLFFIDADLVLHPNTLTALLESDKDIVSNIFWTRWEKNSAELPQVWLKDFYTLYDAHMLKIKSQEQIKEETFEFLTSLRTPGIYRVGGLGACTLIRRIVLEKGVDFSEIYNLSFWGEDRSFCIRAVAYGFELYVNTFYPAFHIFRLEELDSLAPWLESQQNSMIEES